MIINSSPGLDVLRPPVESQLVRVLGERAELGLGVPHDFVVNVGFCADGGSLAFASWKDKTRLVNINAVNSVSRVLSPEDAARAKAVNYFFNTARELFGVVSGEDEVLELLDDPDTFLDDLESKADPELLERKKVFFSERGTSYDRYRAFVLSNAVITRDSLRALTPAVIGSFGNSGLFDILRHEVDHIDFFGSDFHRRYQAVVNRWLDLKRRFHDDGDSDVSRDYAHQGLVYLGSLSEIGPLLEARAMFFDHIPFCGWSEADFGSVASKVEANINAGYIEDFYAEKILDPLVSELWAAGLMNRQTSNYLFRHVNAQRGNSATDRYFVDPNEVRFEVVRDVLYDQIPKWKRRFAENTADSVLAVSAAYEEDPSRLSRLCGASSFREALVICEGLS